MNDFNLIDNTRCCLALNRISGMGPRTVAKLLVRWPDLNELFELTLAQMCQAGLPEKIATPIAAFDLQRIDEDLRWQEEASNRCILTWSHPHYPVLLKEIYDPPVVLYAIGDLSCLQQKTVGIIGTRKPSVVGRETAKRFAFELAACGISIVSGLALGIDAQAHTGCLDAGGKTIAVMGTGINCIYPRQHVTLAERVCQNGLLISEFPLHSQPIAGHFPRRNRIISGLSSSILVVEAAIKSGSLITARLALEQNRDVLAIPGSIHNPQAMGCHHLLKQGAKLVTSSADILHELGLDVQDIRAVCHSVKLADENKNLVECIGYETTTIDHIIVRSGLGVEQVVCHLAELELQGIVTAVPGGYTRCVL
jgi:DNA processing protein